jgi:hypothetical protein
VSGSGVRVPGGRGCVGDGEWLGNGVVCSGEEEGMRMTGTCEGARWGNAIGRAVTNRCRFQALPMVSSHHWVEWT